MKHAVFYFQRGELRYVKVPLYKLTDRVRRPIRHGRRNLPRCWKAYFLWLVPAWDMKYKSAMHRRKDKARSFVRVARAFVLKVKCGQHFDIVSRTVAKLKLEFTNIHGIVRARDIKRAILFVVEFVGASKSIPLMMLESQAVKYDWSIYDFLVIGLRGAAAKFEWFNFKFDRVPNRRRQIRVRIVVKRCRD